MFSSFQPYLVGGLEHGFYEFPFSWEFHRSQLTFTPSFFRGVGWNHQPDILDYLHLSIHHMYWIFPWHIPIDIMFPILTTSCSRFFPYFQQGFPTFGDTVCAEWSDCLWLQLRLRLDHGRGRTTQRSFGFRAERLKTSVSGENPMVVMVDITILP